ncbi:MAG: hypothetical protein JWQ10_1139 [Herbaspirillum sp.]|nr:hypothetical protein [Herbaspirillum sp.]
MHINTLLRGIILAATMFCLTPAFAAEDATMHEVYTAAQAGKFDQAQAMMDKVLHDHPKSAKAHFVESELLAKQGRFTNAEAEFKTAESLAPGLPFASPTSVEQLRARLAAAHTAPHSRPAPQQASATSATEAPGPGMPWGFLLAGAGLIAFIVFAVRFMNMRTGASMGGGGAGSMNGYRPGQPMSPYSPMAPAQAPMMGPAAGGGMGSSILGGLATGAAMGAGIVAGEELMHHFTDGNRSSNNMFDTPYTPDNQQLPDNMGGTDFGISDSGSWDDSSGGGGDDWS